MPVSLSEQGAFVDSYWASLRHDTTQFVLLPGRKKNPDGTMPSAPANVRQLGGGCLPVFDKTPNATAFLETFGQAPHTVIRVGKTGLFAVVETERDVSTPIARIGHTVVSITEQNRFQPVGVLSARQPSFMVNRKFVWETLGRPPEPDMYVSNRHLSLEVNAQTLFARDQYSSNGTRLAVEYVDGPADDELLRLYKALGASASASLL